MSTSTSLGDNIDGPSLIRVPDWIEKPLGRYYLYFANHRGRYIRLAYADSLRGPWKVHEPGVIPVKDTAFYRPQPDPNPEIAYTHVASPEVRLDHQRQRIVLFFHGNWTDGKPFPRVSTMSEVFAWFRKNGYRQYSQAAISRDGLRFEVRPEIIKMSYLRVFDWQGHVYGMGRLGRLGRSNGLLGEFEAGPNPFQDTPYQGRVRHVAVMRRNSRLYVFFSAIGDVPERILVSMINLGGDWKYRKASEARTVLKPEAAHECAELPAVQSKIGFAPKPLRELRDPAIFEEDGKAFLFYSICGEQGLAGAELSFD
ncbi:MAG: hypothetical protein GY953_23885 [bacterium]|nr:hypothetical protein [bacterium]